MESETDDSYKPGSESEAQFTDSEAELNDTASESEAEFTDSEEELADKKKQKRKQASKNKPKKKEKRSRFLDMEATVGDEDDEEEEDEDFLDDDFIAGDDEAEEAAAAAAEIVPRMRRLEKDSKEQEFDAEAEERRLKALYRRVRETQAMKEAAATSSALPKPFLLPTVTDPKLWLCKAQQGRERSAALALLRVIMERQYSGQPLNIFSVVARDGLKGYVYIEAHKPTQVAQAIEIAKLNHCLYPGQAGKSLVLVPLAEMPQVLQTTAATGSAAAGSAAQIPEIGDWIRVKRGKYANDLAQVVDNVQDEGSYDPSNLNTCIIRVKLVPRLQFSSQTASSAANERPPPRLFDPEEASRYGPVSKSRGFWIYGGETYQDGLLFKNMRLSSLITGKVGPTAEEIARFPNAEGKTADEFASGPQDASASITIVAGDQVVITEGEMKNLPATVDTVETRANPATGQSESIALLVADESTGLTGDAARLEVKITHLRKTFRTGEHVRVIAGPRTGESGIVVGEQVGSGRQQATQLIIFSAINNEQFTCPVSQCAKSEQKTVSSLADVAELKETRKPTAGKVEVSLDDLIQYEGLAGEEGVGVVVRILDADNSLVIFDSLGQVKTIPARSIQLLASAPLPNRSVPAFGSDDSCTVKQGDRVCDASSSFFKVLHTYKSLAFLRPLSGGSINNGGVCVMPVSSLSKPTSAASNATAMAAFAGRGLLGKSVTITGGPHKGYVGFVKQINDGIARVELHTNGKVISVAADRLSVSDKEKSRNAPPSGLPNRPNYPAQTPAWNMPTSSARTPAWNMPTSGSARTPAWGASSSAKTPAWNSASAMTPGIAPGRTPAWNAATGMTPAWHAPTAVGQSSTSAAWQQQQRGTTPAWYAATDRNASWDTESNNDNADDRKEKNNWDQMQSWKRDE